MNFLLNLLHKRWVLIGLGCAGFAIMMYYTFKHDEPQLDVPIYETVGPGEMVYQIPDRKKISKKKVRTESEDSEKPKKDEVSILDALAKSEDAPGVLTGKDRKQLEEEAILEEAMEQPLEEKNKPDLTNLKGPNFTARKHFETSRKAGPASDLPVATGKPQLAGWKEKRPPKFDTGERLWAVLSSDLFVSKNKTMALLEVFDGKGNYLGRSMAEVRQDRLLEDRVQIEGHEIIGQNGARIRGHFQAFSPDGSMGLVGETRRHVVGYASKTLYRTALGGLALSLGNGGNTIAGIIGAQAGTEIIDGLSQDLETNEIPRTIMVARGFRFALMFLSPAQQSHGENLEAAPFNAERSVQLYQEQERARKGLGPFQPAQSGFDQALKNPLGWMEAQK